MNPAITLIESPVNTPKIIRVGKLRNSVFGAFGGIHFAIIGFLRLDLNYFAYDIDLEREKFSYP